MLDVQKVEFEYPEKRILQEVSFSLKQGYLLHLQGSNGAGKTTLLKLLAGILSPTSGDIFFDKSPIVTDITTYQKNLCFVGHKTGVNQILTPREHYRFDLYPSKPFNDLIQAFSLQGLEDTPCGLLSAGQRRRVGLLRLLTTNASLWLLDEPLVALDDTAVTLVMTLLNKHLASGGLVILTSHQELPSKPENYQEYRL